MSLWVDGSSCLPCQKPAFQRVVSRFSVHQPRCHWASLRWHQASSQACIRAGGGRGCFELRGKHLCSGSRTPLSGCLPRVVSAQMQGVTWERWCAVSSCTAPTRWRKSFLWVPSPPSLLPVLPPFLQFLFFPLLSLCPLSVFLYSFSFCFWEPESCKLEKKKCF